MKHVLIPSLILLTLGFTPLIPMPSKATKEKKPYLEGKARPQLSQIDLGNGGYSAVTIQFYIRGTMNEEWYCPKLTVDWPDGTKTTRESDCEPWPADFVPGADWAFRRGFPAGRYVVRGCVSKAEKVIGCAEVDVLVVGG